MEVASSSVREDSQEEGEFTPVISKKTKKKLKVPERAIVRPNSRSHFSGRVLPLKSAKHKRF